MHASTFITSFYESQVEDLEWPHDVHLPLPDLAAGARLEDVLEGQVLVVANHREEVGIVVARDPELEGLAAVDGGAGLVAVMGGRLVGATSQLDLGVKMSSEEMKNIKSLSSVNQKLSLITSAPNAEQISNLGRS